MEAEKKGLELDKAQVWIREEQISWLEGLSDDWEMKERTRWRDVVPGVPKTKIRSGTKRSRSQSKGKPGKLKRMKKRARLAKQGSGVGGSGDLSCPARSQPGLGLPRTGSGLGAMDDSLEEVEVVGVAGVLARVGVGSATGSGPAKKMSAAAATRRSRKGGPRVLTYDEIIEGGEKVEVVFPDDLDFQFEIPQGRDSKLQ